MKFIHVGDTVRLKRDIFRIPNDRSSREHVLYASKGTIGIVKDTFKIHPSAGAIGPHAKVLVEGFGIMTFRLTSLEVVNV